MFYFSIFFLSLFRNRIEVIIDYMDNSITTLLLTLICAPHLIKNPYLTAKLIEVFFVISPTIQLTTSKIYNMASGKYFNTMKLNF
jgi:ubiquitin conjugation factor E4 B